jgi:serine/threonine protein kinase
MSGQEPEEFLKEIVGSRYEIQQQLGKKAGRRTLLARDIQTQALVVVKLLSFGDDFVWEDLKLFEREAETLKALSHSAIPQYLDYFELNSTVSKGFALVQSYINAKSLEEQLKAGRSFSETEVKQLAIEILEILKHLHAQKPPVIHRDIKPSNILLTNRSGNNVGEVYLVDFGSVQTLASKSIGTMTVVGTYGYMPPEQFSGRANPASDLYGLGATLIYLITGQHPADLPQIDLRIDFESAANISPRFCHWLKRMTEPIVSKRFASVEEALQALEYIDSVTVTPVQSRANNLTLRKPAGSKVILHKNAESLEIIVPAAGFFSFVPYIYIFYSFVAFNSNKYFLFISSLNGNPWLLDFLAFVSAGCGIYFFLQSGLSWFGRMHFCINHQQIFYAYKLFGIRLYSPPPSPTQNIIRLECSSHAYNPHPYIIVWAGMRRYQLSNKAYMTNFPLSRIEAEWLAEELSDWLGLPIVRN